MVTTITVPHCILPARQRPQSLIGWIYFGVVIYLACRLLRPAKQGYPLNVVCWMKLGDSYVRKLAIRVHSVS